MKWPPDMNRIPKGTSGNACKRRWAIWIAAKTPANLREK